MPSKSPAIGTAGAQQLKALGAQIRARRATMKVSAVVLAESAGLSRVTLHRIERGEPSVASGAYANAAAALGLRVGADAAGGATPPARRPGWIPARIALDDYPQLRQLAWQVHAGEDLAPAEALAIYERNERHLDVQALQPNERDLIEALRLALRNTPRDV